MQIQYLEHNSYDTIEIDNYLILNTMQNFYFREYFIFVYPVGLKHVKPYTGKIFKISIILITKYLNLNWNNVKRFISTFKAQF